MQDNLISESFGRKTNLRKKGCPNKKLLVKFVYGIGNYFKSQKALKEYRLMYQRVSIVYISDSFEIVFPLQISQLVAQESVAKTWIIYFIDLMGNL